MPNNSNSAQSSVNERRLRPIYGKTKSVQILCTHNNDTTIITDKIYTHYGL